MAATSSPFRSGRSFRGLPSTSWLEAAAVKDSASEIWLTSEDTGAYGQDIGSSLAALLERVRRTVEDSDTMVKIGMTNPPYLKPILPQLAETLASPHFFSYLHIPVQVVVSGACEA